VGLLFWVCPGASRMSMPARMGPGTDNAELRGRPLADGPA